MEQQSEDDESESDEMVDVSARVKQRTLEELREADPHALKDTELIRRAISTHIEVQTADEYHVVRDS